MIKRVLPDLGTLFAQPGLVDVFKEDSRRLPKKSIARLEIWKHPAGICVAAPEAGSERLFSTIAAAYENHSLYSFQS